MRFKFIIISINLAFLCVYRQDQYRGHAGETVCYIQLSCASIYSVYFCTPLKIASGTNIIICVAGLKRFTSSIQFLSPQWPVCFFLVVEGKLWVSNLLVVTNSVCSSEEDFCILLQHWYSQTPSAQDVWVLSHGTDFNKAQSSRELRKHFGWSSQSPSLLHII